MVFHEVGQWSELEVVEAPEEPLGGELILVSDLEAQGNVVVFGGAADPSPEEELVQLFVLLELVKSDFETQLLPGVEGLS